MLLKLVTTMVLLLMMRMTPTRNLRCRRNRFESHQGHLAAVA
jgi:hypothetical protein